MVIVIVIVCRNSLYTQGIYLHNMNMNINISLSSSHLRPQKALHALLARLLPLTALAHHRNQ